MRQVGDYCGNREFGAFWRRVMGFLFRIGCHSQDLIADLLRVMSAAMREHEIDAPQDLTSLFSLKENV